MNKKIIVYGSILVTFILLIVFLYLRLSLPTFERYVPVEATSTTQQHQTPQYQYIEIVDGCNHAFVGDCVNMRSGPGLQYPVVIKLRTGAVLKVAETITNGGKSWYKILFSHELVYPERVKGDWYVSADYAQLFSNEGDHNLKKGQISTTTKHIIVDVSEQKTLCIRG